MTEMKKTGIETVKARFYYSPVLIMIFLCITVYIVEMLIMLYFPFVAFFPKWVNAFTDALLLTVFILPAFYYLISRQARFHIDELLKANTQLQTEVAERKKTEETLRMYEHIVSSSSEHMSLIDRNYVYRAVNNTYLVAHQKRRDEIVGHSVAELHSEKVFQGMVKERLDLCLNGQTVKYQSWFDFPGKGRTYVDVVYYPFLTADGSVSGVVVVARDITEHRQAEEALRNSEERLRALGNALPDIAFILDEHGRYIEVLAQQQQEKLLYADGNTLKGKLLHDVLPKESAELFLSVVRRTIETQENQVVEYLFSVQAGERWFEGRTALLQVPGKDKMVVWVSIDITERKEVEEKVRRSEASLAEAQRIAHLGNWEWDIAGGKLRWSDEIYRIFGLAPQEFAASYEVFLNRVHPDDREYVKEAVNKALYENIPYSIDHRIILPDGTIRIVHEQGEVSLDAAQKPVRMIGTVQDITEQKSMEEELERYSKELEARVRKRTAELEEKTIQAEAANRAKSDFLNNMSHELKTPMNAIIGFSELLKDGQAGPLTDEQRDYLNDIWESGKHLNRIIDDMLSMTKIETGIELELSEFQLKEAMEKVIDHFREKAIKQRIIFQTDIAEDIGLITADKGKIETVIQNLIGNAFKFTPDGGSVRVAARRVQSSELGVGSSERERQSGVGSLEKESIYSEPDADFVEISVADTGIGILKEDMGRLFHPFQQLASTLTKKYEGVGLGLVICKKYVELHGGRIWCESEPGKGSNFIFTIPEKI